MTRNRRIFAAAALTACAATAFGFAGGGDDYDLNWFTIDAGGEYSFNGDLELTGTIGQPDAGSALIGGDFSLAGGFWTGGPVEGPEIAALFDFRIITGTLLGGGLSDLDGSDDSYVHTRSGFGRTFIDLHHMEMQVLASTTVNNPSTIDLSIEARINEPAGTAQVRAFNWMTGQYDTIGQYALNDSDSIRQFMGLDASKYVSNIGEVDITMKHIVFRPFFAYFFESFVDEVEVAVHQ